VLKTDHPQPVPLMEERNNPITTDSYYRSSHKSTAINYCNNFILLLTGFSSIRYIAGTNIQIPDMSLFNSAKLSMIYPKLSNTSWNVQIIKQMNYTLLTHLQKENCSWHWTLWHDMIQGPWSSFPLLPPSPSAETAITIVSGLSNSQFCNIPSHILLRP
jgi:hypothetical protein